MRAIGGAGHEITLASRHRSYDGDGNVRRQQQLKAEGEREAMGMLEAYAKEAAMPPELWFTYHLYYKAPDWIGPVVADELGIPYVVAEASVAPKRAGGAWDMGHRGVLRSLHAARLVIGFNANDEACVSPHLSSGADYVHVAPFIDCEPYQAAARERPTYRAMTAGQYGLPFDEPWLLTVAMMRPGDKTASYRLLADSLARIADRPWRLLVVGDGDSRSEIADAFVPVADRVTWLGAQAQDSLPGIYAAADLYVWPGVNEAFGMAFLEAQASGLPVIACDEGGVHGVVAAPQGGTLVEKRDVGAFSDAVAALLGEPATRSEMGRCAQSSIVRDHGLFPAAKTIDRLLNGLRAPCA